MEDCFLTDFFSALNDPIRRQILSLLSTQEMSAGDIASHFPVSRPAISHHLSILKDAGLVDYTREGQNIKYRINLTLIQEAIAWLYSLKGADQYVQEQRAKEKGRLSKNLTNFSNS